MPYKANADRRHHIPKQRYQVRNWREYDAALRQRGSLTVWVTQEAIERWRAESRTTPGGQRLYSDLAITTALTLRVLFRLPLRQTEGLLGSILELLQVDLAVPDHSTISRRGRAIRLPKLPASGEGGLHLLIDSSGLKLCGPGEWLIEKHGLRFRRAWRKLHLGVDAGTGRIVAAVLTEHDIDDGSQVGSLLDQMTEPVAAVIADGAYDRQDVYDAVHQRHPDAAVVVPPRATAVLSERAEADPTPRDRHIKSIAECGRLAWQTATAYNLRALVEAAFSRFKRVIGDRLLAHDKAAQESEVAIAIAILNHMLDLGRPDSVRIA
jgi:transposase